jgi:hypothetical protein
MLTRKLGISDCDLKNPVLQKKLQTKTLTNLPGAERRASDESGLALLYPSEVDGCNENSPLEPVARWVPHASVPGAEQAKKFVVPAHPSL